MPRFSHVAALSLALLLTNAAGCTRAAPKSEHTGAPVAGRSEPLILAWSEGERRVRRPPPSALSTLGAPFILKIDARNGGAPEFVMLTEDIPPGQAIPFHRHPHADEILFVQAGAGVVTLGNREAAVTSGATIYMPRNTVVGLRNTGAEPLKVLGIFSRPGYEQYLREISVPEGAPIVPLTIEELSAIRSRHLETAVYGPASR
jgi:quercetin dioxygenase-like cupin family protein